MPPVTGRLLVLVALGLIGCGLRVWHVLLVRLIQGQPPTLAGWLIAILALVVAGRALAQRLSAPSRGRLARRWAEIGAADLWLLAFFLTLVWQFDINFTRAASDGREYFVQVRSLVIDGDLDFTNENATFGVRGTAQLYAFGAPLLWVPFFAAAHAWLMLLNALGGHYVLDGFTNPYQRAVGFGTLVYGAIGLTLVYRILSAYFTRAMAALSTLAMCAGSFLVWYLAVDNSMVHGASMFATTLFLYLWHRARPAMTTGRWIGLGLAAGLMAMVRWQNLVFAVVPVVMLMLDGPRVRRSEGPTVRDRVSGLLLFASAAVVAFLPQLVFWKVVRGGWLAAPAAEHGMHWTSLHVADVLFSANHGLLSWSPIVYLALPGLLLFARRDWRLAAALAAGLAGQIYVNSAVDVWWGGAGFGARRFDNSALVFAIGLAATLEWLRRRPLVAPLAVVGVLLFVNASFMMDFKQGRLSSADAVTFDEILDAAYWRVGNPFSFPMNAWVAWRYGGTGSLYDRLRGREFNNLAIDVGTPADEPFLTEGWSDRDRGADFTFRWSSGRASAMVVPLMQADDYTLDLRCAPFAFPNAPTQTIAILVNGQRVGEISLPPDLSEHRLLIPRAALRANLNRIEFRYGYTRSPRSAGTGDDTRELSALFDWIRLTRLTSPK